MVCDWSQLPAVCVVRALLLSKIGSCQVVVEVIAPEENLLAADVVIHAADPLIVGVVGRNAVQVGAARIRGNREVGGGQLESRRIERGNRNLVAGVRVAARILQLFGRTQAAAGRLGGIHHAEVALQRRGRGVIGRLVRRVAALPRALVAAEEEQLILDDPCRRPCRRTGCASGCRGAVAK